MSDLLEGEPARLLCKVDILESLTEGQLEELDRLIPSTHVERGRVLYAPGERSGMLFMIKSGRVRIYKVTPEGK